MWAGRLPAAPLGLIQEGPSCRIALGKQKCRVGFAAEALPNAPAEVQSVKNFALKKPIT